MMRLRYRDGRVVQYNIANYVERRDKVFDLYTRKDGAWLAQVCYEPGLILEVVLPCRVYREKVEKRRVL